jgi:hypothetical protein
VSCLLWESLPTPNVVGRSGKVPNKYLPITLLKIGLVGCQPQAFPRPQGSKALRPQAQATPGFSVQLPFVQLMHQRQLFPTSAAHHISSSTTNPSIRPFRDHHPPCPAVSRRTLRSCSGLSRMLNSRADVLELAAAAGLLGVLEL